MEGAGNDGVLCLVIGCLQESENSLLYSPCYCCVANFAVIHHDFLLFSNAPINLLFEIQPHKNTRQTVEVVDYWLLWVLVVKTVISCHGQHCCCVLLLSFAFSSHQMLQSASKTHKQVLQNTRQSIIQVDYCVSWLLYLKMVFWWWPWWGFAVASIKRTRRKQTELLLTSLTSHVFFSSTAGAVGRARKIVEWCHGFESSF